MSIAVRERTDADIEAAAEVLVKVHALDGYPVEGVADPVAWLQAPRANNAWVALLDGQIVGHALVTQPGATDAAVGAWAEMGGDPEKTVSLARLFVDPAARGQGVGVQLTRTAMQWAQERGLRLVLDVMDKDKSAIRIYERLGWRSIGTAMHDTGQGTEVLAHLYLGPEEVR